MASTAVSARSKGENISHFTGVRLRVIGSGQLQLSMVSMSEINTQVMLPLTMSTATNREPLRLCNFNEQRAALIGKTTDFRDRFRINRIIIFSKEVATEYPGIS